MTITLNGITMTDNKLKLDEELVRQLLAEDNVIEADDTNPDIMLERIKDHFDFELTDGWAKNPDMMFYTETTSDGYEVWVATDDDQRPSINEDIYYYENDWLEKMADAMTDGLTIYFQELNDDNYEFQEVVHNVYEEYYNDKKQELIEKLIDDGYEWEEE
jgi:hypothetical protein|tara:strand:+ start:514 stop:993 length:480 start_codon:yes stop_codon:yes gene_type:complete